ncbi:HAD family hydrolase [Solibacillus daqui]|uniref:HAD family hydrolase n=1 Tax=Solibacillus daqui TaxID=2912187 RepID=UPI0023659B0D|nr:HAD family hydrolase [Solibacillus daqui]
MKAILFDLDGTLLNRDASVKVFVEKQYERLHNYVGHIPKEQYTERFIELDQRGYVWKDKVYAQLVQEFAITNITSEQLLEDYLHEFKYSCVAFPNLIELLEALKKAHYKLGIITNGYGQFQMDNIKALQIEHYFDVILVSEWEGMKKPDERIFLKAVGQLQVTPSESVFVGDHPENDVKAARRIGMKGVWKKDDQWDDVLADAVIEDLLELLPVLEKIRKTHFAPNNTK